MAMMRWYGGVGVHTYNTHVYEDAERRRPVSLSTGMSCFPRDKQFSCKKYRGACHSHDTAVWMYYGSLAAPNFHNLQ